MTKEIKHGGAVWPHNASILAVFTGILLLTFLPNLPIKSTGYEVLIGQYQTNIAVRGAAHDQIYNRVWDANELVIIEEDSALIYTNFEEYSQTNGACDDKHTPCQTDSDCRTSDPSPSGDGIYTGTCDTTSSFCIISGWCPAVPRGVKSGPPRLNLDHIRRFIVRVDNYVTFEETSLKLDNNMSKVDGKDLKIECLKADYKKDDYRGDCTTYTLGSILDQALGKGNSSELIQRGLTVALGIQWNCKQGFYVPHVSWLSPSPTCELDYTFTRVDDGSSLGFKEGTTTFRPTAGDRRTLYINYVVNLVVQVDSNLKRLSLINIITSIGAKWSFFSLCYIVLVVIRRCLECCKKCKEQNQDDTNSENAQSTISIQSSTV